MFVLDTPLGPSEKVQWMMLMYLLCMKEQRASVKASSFSSPEFQQAANEIKEGSGYSALQRLLEECEVPWEIGSGSPIPNILKALERDGAFAHHVQVLSEIIKQTHIEGGRCHKEEFMERLQGLPDAVQCERNKADDFRAEFERQEALRKEREAKLDAEKGLK